MDLNQHWTTCVLLLFTSLLFNSASSHEASSGHRMNVDNKTHLKDTVSGQHMQPFWYSAPTGVAPQHATVNSHSGDRWRQRMTFSKAVYSFEVKEDTAPGTTVGKVDTALKAPTPITYSVQEDDGEGLFFLNPFSGEFLLSRSLDFEAQSLYILTVAVQQGDSQVSSVRVYFNVLDVNDNPPVFSRGTFSVFLLEDTRVGTCFLSVNASDKDNGENGVFRLSVAGEDEEKVFFINPSGSLCLRAELDREVQNSYDVTVIASDCVQPAALQLTSTAQVRVAVGDVNDNAPRFVSDDTVRIPEDAALRSLVMTVRAEDEDDGSNGLILYYLITTAGGAFSIDSRSGEIHLEETLDREVHDSLILTVTAIDEGSPRMTTTSSLTVLVEDVNDHDPEFSSNLYNVVVSEDVRRGTSLLQVTALDRDIGMNAEVRYMLAQTSPFTLDAIRGVVAVTGRLDRERDADYTLTVTAVDLGEKPRSSTAVINITVTDVNDFVPVFVPESLSLHVLENEEDLAELTYQVSALDEDFGINSQLQYFILSGNNDPFSITLNGTFQILHSLDREAQPQYCVTIVAIDLGLPPLTGTQRVQIIVDDVNDNRPAFTEEAYTTMVSEDSPAGTVFAMVTASDIDEGVSGELRYHLESLDMPFAIDETSGEMFTTDVLDRETVAVYRLVVIGSDMHPSHPLSSSVVVTVLIGDVNDHWPEFLSGPYVAYVPTGLVPGSVVCAVTATDEDAEMNAELRYSLYGYGSDLFSIDPRGGTVYTTGVLQQTEGLVLNVHVEDSGEIPKYDISTISVRFQNIAEFPEMRVDTVNGSLSEDAPVGTLVAVASAASVRAEPVSFYLASGNFEDVFHVDQLSGVLTVDNTLDYESKQEFVLLMEARDSASPPFSSFEEIYISISDVNDNYPQFSQAEYRCEVPENHPPSWICDVLAVDADSDNFGQVQYNITAGNVNNYFTVDRGNGFLSTTAALDREDVPVFNLTVEAAELNDPSHRDRATVIIFVLDRNDNAPRFSQIFLTEVPEDSPVGHTVIQITSSDDDLGINAVMNYFIIDDDDDDDDDDDVPFTISFITGSITVKGPLDREKRDQYILKVSANDSAWSISTDVTIVITDVNDNGPLFSEDVYSIVFTETRDKDVFVVQLVATDADVGQNSDIFYVIDPSNELFWVNSSSGEIFTKKPLILDKSSFELYQFTVFAFDCGHAPLSTNTTATVRLEPINLHPPSFLPHRHRIPIPHHMTVGTEVVTFNAIDQDRNSSAGIKYVLLRSNGSHFFWLQEDSGKVTLEQSVEDSVNSYLMLSVQAVDRGSPSLSSQTEVTFEITGRNQFPPVFREPDVAFSVPEDLAVGSLIGRVHAEDMDYGANGAIFYRINPENQDSPLSVGERSGILTLIKELDFETDVIYHLQIEATDIAWFSQSSTLNTTVIVLDVNDNPPVFLSTMFTTSVPENSEIGTTVLDVRATDADSGVNAQTLYALVSDNKEKFAINPGSGTVTTLEMFDYELEQAFDVTVKATNAGTRSLFSMARIVIHITDVNEFMPTFEKKHYYFSVFRNAMTGTRVGRVTATDRDGGPAGQVFYIMFGQNKNKGFEIDQISGEIYTSGNLRKNTNSDINLRVLAKNQGVVTGGDVDETLIHISMIEMTAPVFASPIYSVNITENSPAGSSVITVSVLDEDSVHFIFSIENGNTGLSFVIDPSSGIISVNSDLDRELLPFYNLTVKAVAHGSSPTTGTANVIVSVVDMNDNPPQLVFAEAQVKENQPPGTTVAKLKASDLDLPPNQGPFTYWLLSPSTDFSLTSDGMLSTLRTLDREDTSAYQVLVVVRDAGKPPLSTTASLFVRIVDENDNPSLPRNIAIEVKYFGASFPGGMIGNVHPEDPDESDTFSCTIKSGPLNMFTIAHGTCELWSSPFQGEATFNLTVEATDQSLSPVNNSVYVNYKGFTSASVDSCIFFYVSSTSLEKFLSYKYLRFVKALDSLFNLQASKTHVFGIKHLGSEILLLAAVKNYHGQYLSREVATSVSSAHRKLLETQSDVTISHISGDSCLTGPCRNGATCKHNLSVSHGFAVLESKLVVYVSPRTQVFSCSCPKAFTGTLCEDDVNECDVNPCGNNGTCVNTLGGFFCQCHGEFSGSDCFTSECASMKCQNGGTCVPSPGEQRCQCASGFEGKLCEQVIDHCRSFPCIQGSCINSQTGFSCHCPFGASGVRCEESSHGFQELSFIEFPPLDRRINIISLEFATLQTNSLLLYNPGGSSNREFLALEILDGAVHLSYDLGSGPERLQTSRQVADGDFHTVTVRRIGYMGSLHVDNCSDTENNGLCFAEGRSLERTLDVEGNMTIGGLSNFESTLLPPVQIKSHYFVGCMRNLHVNGVPLKPSTALAAYNIIEGCPRTGPSPCLHSPCKNGGTCHDLWFHSICECKIPFAGDTCSQEMAAELVLHFTGYEYIEFITNERARRDYLLKYLVDGEKENSYGEKTGISIKFKTQNNGALLSVVGQTEYHLLKLNDGKLMYMTKSSASGYLSEMTVDSPVADGDWHVLDLSSNGRDTYVNVDGKAALNVTDHSLDFNPLGIRKIVFGASLTDDPLFQYSGFTGCLQYFNMSHYTLPVSRHSAMLDVWLSPTLVQSSCISPHVCFSSFCSDAYGCLAPSPCQNRRMCEAAAENSSCLCFLNTSGHTCDICTSATESHWRCSESRGGTPLWLVALTLPLILMITGMFVAFNRIKRQNSTSQSEDSPHKEPGTDNVGFCFADEGTKRTKYDPVGVDQQTEHVEFFCDASPLDVQPVTNSELDYYEIGSISNRSPSDVASVEISRHATNLIHATPTFNRGDLRALLEGLKKECLSDDTKGHAQFQCVASVDAESWFQGPAQCLTFEEIHKLNTPLGRLAGHAEGTAGQSYRRDTPTGASPFIIWKGGKSKHTDLFLQGQEEAENIASKDHCWDTILDMRPPVKIYLPVFEEISHLPAETGPSCDI